MSAAADNQSTGSNSVQTAGRTRSRGVKKTSNTITLSSLQCYALATTLQAAAQRQAAVSLRYEKLGKDSLLIVSTHEEDMFQATFSFWQDR